jgi:predicted metal-dependent hydrolase
MATIQGDGFIVNIIKSKRRKTMALKVDANGVSAHIPSNLPLTTATAFIKQKTSWIKNKLAQQQQRNVEKKQFVNGEIFLLLGENVTLHLFQADKKAIVKKTATTIEFYGRLNRLSKSAIRAAIIDWYKKQAHNYLTARTQWLSDITGLQPTSITVKSYKARWGSCSSKGDINYNWQLVQAPPEVIDYVITHELCHLTHHNHSPAFWQLVTQFIPDFKQHRQWLKANGHTLSV